jgi:heterodisulfide reductase subunit B
MKYTYYPGCAAESTARDQHSASLAVARALGIEMEELKGWICCGATPAHQTDRVLAASLSAANLALAKERGLDVVVNCAACYNRLKSANHEVINFPDIRERVAHAVGRDYDGSVNIRHFVEVVLEVVGIPKLQTFFRQSLNGLKVACYYGCLLVRPPEVTGFDDPENPMSLDNLITAMGGQSLDWPHKVECCGGGLSLTRTDVVVKLSASILDMAKASGADCIAVACPMCQANLDLRQRDVEKETGSRYAMPVMYITQLLGLCLGVPHDQLGFEKLMVEPQGIVERVK